MVMSRREQRELRQNTADMRELLALPAGRRFLIRFVAECGAFHANPQLDGKIEGRRQVALWLIAEMNRQRATAFAELQMEAAREVVHRAEDEDETDETGANDNDD